MNISTNFSRGSTIAVLAALFLALVILNDTLLRGIRVDLTANKLYTLSEGTGNILGQIQEPINLYLFFSEKETKAYPKLRNYYNRVKEVLEEYRLLAGDGLKLHYVDPEPFSEEEDRATQLGLQAATIKGGGKIYFGLAGTNALDAVEIIPFMQSERESFLEYDLNKLIYGLIRVKKPKLGLMTDLPMYATKRNPQTGKMNDPWAITQELEQVFDVKLVFTDSETIDPKIDVLMVVHPKDLSENTRYAIDQFIMRGGRGLFFVDPYSEADQIFQPDGAPTRDFGARSSSLNSLFNAWGFSVPKLSVVADLARALSVNFTDRQIAVSHPAALNMRPADFDRKDVVMDGLEEINLYLASYIEVAEGSELDVTELIKTSRQSMPIPRDRLSYLWNPKVLTQGLSPTGEHYLLAARIEGNFTSAFDAPPDRDKDEGEEDASEARKDDTHEHISQTAQPGILAVVSDTDILSNQMWAKTGKIFGQSFVQPFASNRDFVINLVDNLLGSKDLIGIRSRASYSRPFIKVKRIEQQANRKYQATEKGLREQLAQTESKLQALQRQRNDKKSKLLTKSQRAEVRKFRAKKIEIRKKLRNVQHQLVKDIENLGGKVKAINIVTMPVLVTIAALLIGFLRVRRRKKAAS